VIVIGPIRVLSVIAAPLACLAGASPPTVESENVGERGCVKGSPSGPSAASREAVSLYAGAGGDHHSLVMGVRRRVLPAAKPAGVPRLFAQPAAAGPKLGARAVQAMLDEGYTPDGAPCSRLVALVSCALGLNDHMDVLLGVRATGREDRDVDALAG